jgi:hypothetical protein
MQSQESIPMKTAISPILAAAIVGTLVAGCATPSQQAAQAERDVDMMIQIYGPACQKLGFPRDTDGWRNCLIGLSQKDAAAAAANAYAGPPYWRYPF